MKDLGENLNTVLACVKHSHEMAMVSYSEAKSIGKPGNSTLISRQIFFSVIMHFDPVILPTWLKSTMLAKYKILVSNSSNGYPGLGLAMLVHRPPNASLMQRQLSGCGLQKS